MKHLFLVLGTSIVVLPWLISARAQADVIQWSASADVIGMDGFHGVTSNIYPGTTGSNFIYIGMGYGPTTNGINSENVPLVKLYASATGTNWGDIDNKFSGPSASYQLSLLLHDQASGDSGTLTFHGYFSGNLVIAGYNPDPLKNTFVGPTTQTLTLGHNLYTVTLGPVVLPQDATPQNDNPNADLGSISASIAVQPAVNSTPEPSSLVLAGLGLSSLAVAGWRRRRQRRRAIVDSGASKA